jgi:hypothetical protein
VIELQFVAVWGAPDGVEWHGYREPDVSPPGGWTVPAEVADLEDASRMAAKVAWGEEPAVVVGEAIEAMLGARNAADAALLSAVRSFAARGEHRAEGHPNVAAWLQHTCRLPKAHAQRLARLSRFLDHHPVLADALAAGRISVDHVSLFAGLHRERYAEAWAEALPLLVDYAAVADFADVARRARRFADDLKPTDADDRFEQQLAGRRFQKSTTIDGYGWLRGWLDPITYAVFAAEHDRLVQAEFDADWDAARTVLGRDPDPVELAELTRTSPQRSADALRVMAERSTTLAGGTVAAAAEVVIHLTQDDYEAGLARVMGDHEAHNPPDGFCETDDGTVVSPVAAVYLSLIGTIRRVVYSADDEIISYGRARRGYTPTQAAAVRAKYRHCAHPWGCDRTGRSLQTDHITEWGDGGPTDVANAQCLCGFHNRWKTHNKNRPPPPDRPPHGGARRTRPPPTPAPAPTSADGPSP